MSKVRKQNLAESVNSQSSVSIKRDEAHTNAQREALALIERGFHLGGIHSVPRDELHERLGAGHHGPNSSNPK